MGLLDSIIDPRSIALLGMAEGLLNAGGPSRTPVGIGQAVGQGVQGAVGGYQKGLEMQDAGRKRKYRDELAKLNVNAPDYYDQASKLMAMYGDPAGAADLLKATKAPKPSWSTPVMTGQGLAQISPEGEVRVIPLTPPATYQFNPGNGERSPVVFNPQTGDVKPVNVGMTNEEPAQPYDPMATWNHASTPKAKERMQVVAAQNAEKELADLRGAFQTAKQNLNDIDEFMSINSRRGTGWGVDNIPGVRSLNPDTQSMDALTARLQGTMRPKGSGSTSDFEQRLYRSGTVSVDKSGEANRKISDTYHKNFTEGENMLNFAEQYFADHGHLNGWISEYDKQKGPKGANAAGQANGYPQSVRVQKNSKTGQIRYIYPDGRIINAN